LYQILILTLSLISVELDTIDLSYRFFGNTINANMIQLGAAFQTGLIPLERESILQAINLNKSGAENNIKAFNLGRLAAHDPKNPIFKQTENSIQSVSVNDLKEILASYSKKSLKVFNQIESTLNANKDLSKNMIEEVLMEYGRVCLIKDEYRVASIHLKNYKKIINNEFSSWSKLSFYLAPPILSFIKDKKTGNPRKFKVPGYIALPLFYALDKISFLRDTPLDIFKYSKERKHDYEHKRIFEQILNTALKNAKEAELKNMIQNKIPPPIVTLFFGLCIYFSRDYFLSYEYKLLDILSYMCYFIGLCILILAVNSFKKQSTTVNPIKIENASSLVTSGVFEYSRNPMYLGMALILLGLALMFNVIGGTLFTLLFTIYITKFQIKPEEEVMEKLFGEDFLKYKQNVRMWL
jgi:protein-S-isoprenylcysteine O-methyltransferase Ste14